MAFRACRAIHIFAMMGMILEAAGDRINRQVLKATLGHARSQEEPELSANHVDALLGRFGVQKPLQEQLGALEGSFPSLAEVGHSSVGDGGGKKGRPLRVMAFAMLLALMDPASALSIGKTQGLVPARSQFGTRGEAPLMSTAGHAEKTAGGVQALHELPDANESLDSRWQRYADDLAFGVASGVYDKATTDTVNSLNEYAAKQKALSNDPDALKELRLQFYSDASARKEAVIYHLTGGNRDLTVAGRLRLDNIADIASDVYDQATKDTVRALHEYAAKEDALGNDTIPFEELRHAGALARKEALVKHLKKKLKAEATP